MNCSSLALAAALLAGCTTYEPQWVKEQNAVVAQRPDIASAEMLKCDALFPRYSDAHRLCLMRSFDRLGVVVAEGGYPRAAVPVLPYAYPPLAPQYAVPVVPTPAPVR